MIGSVVSVNVSSVREIDVNGTAVPTGILKEPAIGRVAIRGVNLVGDDQADRNAHGGPDRVAYAYAEEDYAWWRERLQRDLAPGLFGENLTLRGIDVSGAAIGERWRVGNTVLRVTSPRVPCFKLARVMDDPRFTREFARTLRPGAYLAVVEEGDVARGDPVEIVARPAHDLTVAEMARIFLFDQARAREMLVAAELPESWRQWVFAR